MKEILFKFTLNDLTMFVGVVAPSADVGEELVDTLIYGALHQEKEIIFLSLSNQKKERVVYISGQDGVK